MDNSKAHHHLLSAWKIIPHFPSSNIKDTVNFYTENLHFHLGGIEPDDCPQEEVRMCSCSMGSGRVG